MDGNYELEKRKYVIGGAAAVIIIVYLIRLFTLQLLSEDFKISADSNAFLKRIQYPARGSISDRNGKLLVYNQPAYDVMVIMNEQVGVDTLDLCESLDITREWYERRMEEIKDRKRNPGYSSYTQQVFLSQLSTVSKRSCSASLVSIFRREAFANTTIPMRLTCLETSARLVLRI